MKQHEFEAGPTDFRDLGRIDDSEITWEGTNGTYYYWTGSLGNHFAPNPQAKDNQDSRIFTLAM